VEGPVVSLEPKIAVAVALILHELVTNAAKYGALAQPNGRIAIAWRLGGVDNETLRFMWRENGLTGIKRPNHRGFGSRMVETSVKHELGGRVETSYRDDGVTYEIEFPRTG
jgi:two-component sensor histidine kinase